MEASNTQSPEGTFMAKAGLWESVTGVGAGADSAKGKAGVTVDAEAEAQSTGKARSATGSAMRK